VHYPALYPSFRAICAKHGCLPADSGGMHNAIRRHWAYVFKLGQGDLPPQTLPTTPFFEQPTTNFQIHTADTDSARSLPPSPPASTYRSECDKDTGLRVV
jgi:hypothetical protein